MTAGSNLLPLVLSISLVISLSAFVQGQGMKGEGMKGEGMKGEGMRGEGMRDVDIKKLRGQCEVARVVRPDKCDLIGDSVALVAIHNGAVHVALKLDRNGKKARNGTGKFMTREDDMQSPTRRKRDEDGSGKRKRGGEVRMVRDTQQAPRCIKVPNALINACRKRIKGGSKCGRPMSFKPLCVQLTGDTNTVCRTPLVARRKIKPGVVDCTSQTTLQSGPAQGALVDQVTLEYKTMRAGVNVTVEVDLFFFKDDDYFPAGSMKTNIVVTIECEDECDKIESVRLGFLINLGAKRDGNYKCDKDTPNCKVPYENGGGVDFSLEYTSDGVKDELNATALTFDGNNMFAIELPAVMKGRKSRMIIYDPIVSASATVYTGTEEEGEIFLGVYSAAAKMSFFYPIFVLTLLVKVLVIFQ